LIPLAAELRRRGVKNRIGFFLHIPWPACDLFVVLPNHARLASELAAYDLVGLQTDDDVDNFLSYLKRETPAAVRPDGIVHGFDRTFAVRSFPVGIDTEEFTNFARRPPGPAVRRLLKRLEGRMLMLGVDRLDYSKGIAPRFEAVERLVKLSPGLKGHFT